jgi:hypothetical protein
VNDTDKQKRGEKMAGMGGYFWRFSETLTKSATKNKNHLLIVYAYVKN